MSKIFEALQLAGRPRENGEPNPMPVDMPPAPDSYSPYPAAPVAEPGPMVQKLVHAVEPAPFPVHLEQTMTALYNSIASLLPTAKGRSIEFIAPHRGAGNSTLIREFAKVAAVNLKKSVLLLDADHHAPTQAKSFQIEQQSGWDAVL